MNSLTERLLQSREEGRALLATNYYNLETLKGVLEACAARRAPIILQLTESSIQYMGLANAVALGRSALRSFGVEGWLHLDHGGSQTLVMQALEAGFDSVMFDGSELPFDENVLRTGQVVEAARRFGANVEAELGYVAKLGQSADKVAHTDPEDARRFVAATGVNALAVAIGNAHGFYKSEPKLDLERVTSIRSVCAAALVLHGSSGIPDAQLQAAVRAGFSKINLATEIKNVFMQTLKHQMSTTQDIDLRKVFPPATQAVTELVAKKLDVLADA